VEVPLRIEKPAQDPAQAVQEIAKAWGLEDAA
jgi:hypothetical protein